MNMDLFINQSNPILYNSSYYSVDELNNSKAIVYIQNYFNIFILILFYSILKCHFFHFITLLGINFFKKINNLGANYKDLYLSDLIFAIIVTFACFISSFIKNEILSFFSAYFITFILFEFFLTIKHSDFLKDVYSTIINIITIFFFMKMVIFEVMPYRKDSISFLFLCLKSIFYSLLINISVFFVIGTYQCLSGNYDYFKVVGEIYKSRLYFYVTITMYFILPEIFEDNHKMINKLSFHTGKYVDSFTKFLAIKINNISSKNKILKKNAKNFQPNFDSFISLN